MIVAWRNGSPVRLEQLGRVLDSVENDKVAAWFQRTRARDPGGPAAAGNQYRRSGGQHPEAAADVPARNSAVASIFRSRSTRRQSIRGSIHDVEFTLVLTICLVVMVIFLFLRNLSATLIPGAAVPLSIIGTFAVMYLLGYSLNNLSLMALTLSVGFVVDDAIVMLENIVRHMEMGKSRMEAALVASSEIGFTIVSMTISLVAVFIPVLFLGGIVGRLLHEFSVTIVVAILISGFVSLSLTPMLGSRFLRAEPRRAQHGRVYRTARSAASTGWRGYECTLGIAMRHRFATLMVAAADAGGHVLPVLHHAHRLHPEPGQRFHVRGHAWPAQDISFESMAEHQHAVAEIVQHDPERAGRRRDLRNRRAIAAFVFAHMKPRDERTLSVDEIIEELRPKMRPCRGS